MTVTSALSFNNMTWQFQSSSKGITINSFDTAIEQLSNHCPDDLL